MIDLTNTKTYRQIDALAVRRQRAILRKVAIRRAKIAALEAEIEQLRVELLEARAKATVEWAARNSA